MSEEQPTKSLVPDVRELVRTTVMMRKEYFWYPDGIENKVQEVLELMFGSVGATKEQIVATASYVLKMNENKKGDYQLPEQIKKVMEDAEAKSKD